MALPLWAIQTTRRLGGGVRGVRTNLLWNPFEANEPPLKQTNPPPPPLEKILFSKKNVLSSKKRTPLENLGYAPDNPTNISKELYNIFKVLTKVLSKVLTKVLTQLDGGEHWNA